MGRIMIQQRTCLNDGLRGAYTMDWLLCIEDDLTES